MGKIVAWFLSFTKLGKVVDPIQQFLSGKKAYLAGAGLAVPALVTIIQKFADHGLAYLMTVTSTPEWALLLNGLGIMGLRAAITKAADPEQDPNVKAVAP